MLEGYKSIDDSSCQVDPEMVLLYEALTGNKTGCYLHTIQEISDEMDIPPATVHRMIKSSLEKFYRRWKGSRTNFEKNETVF